jgi:hypothetical protein
VWIVGNISKNVKKMPERKKFGKNLPIYQEGASRAAGKWPLPGRSGSTLWIDGKLNFHFPPSFFSNLSHSPDKQWIASLIPMGALLIAILICDLR